VRAGAEQCFGLVERIAQMHQAAWLSAFNCSA
jgi:hypothetical protein